MKKTELLDAITRRLGEVTQPVISRYQLGQAIHAEALSLQTAPNSKTVADCEKALIQRGILRPITGIRANKAYTLLGTNITDPRVLACGLDPFCYVSHLSAMEFHGITDRMPEIVYISSPAPKRWKEFALARMGHDLAESLDLYLAQGLPPIGPITFTKLLGKTVHRTASLHLGAYRVYQEQHMRVASLGRTFLDMLRSPELCGGINHVIDCYREHAQAYLRLIFDEIDQHGSPIDKVRAGYILETLCHSNSERITAWKAFARRGGSRKLDPHQAYSEQFSEDWCLSINTPVPNE
jgi:hypothetical protein